MLPRLAGRFPVSPIETSVRPPTKDSLSPATHVTPTHCAAQGSPVQPDKAGGLLRAAYSA